MNDCRDKLELKYGRRDLLDVLDESKERAGAGEIEGILVIELREDKEIHRAFAWKDDMQFRWARFAAAAGAVVHELNAEGLEAE